MLNRLSRLKKVWRLFFLGAALFPFLFRHLLVLTMDHEKPFSREANLNEGQVKHLGKTLVRQLGSQAQEFDSRDQDPFALGVDLPDTERIQCLFGGLPSGFLPPFSSHPLLKGFSVPLRI